MLCNARIIDTLCTNLVENKSRDILFTQHIYYHSFWIRDLFVKPALIDNNERCSVTYQSRDYRMIGHTCVIDTVGSYLPTWWRRKNKFIN